MFCFYFKNFELLHLPQTVLTIELFSVVVELDLSDITSVKCRVLCVGETEPFVSDDQATKVFQR